MPMYLNKCQNMNVSGKHKKIPEHALDRPHRARAIQYRSL